MQQLRRAGEPAAKAFPNNLAKREAFIMERRLDWHDRIYNEEGYVFVNGCWTAKSEHFQDVLKREKQKRLQQ